MDEQISASEHTHSEYADLWGESEDSDGESSLHPPLAPASEGLSVLERLGLNSCENMTEEEVESAFARFVMAFHCDQHTLTPRLHAEEHDRSVAEQNLRETLQHTRDTLQVLCGRLVESAGRRMVRQMEESLHLLENSIENIITAAENLGAVHQEARVSHAVELMALHMENLQKRHTVESTELLQTRKLLQRNRGRTHSDSTEDGEARQMTGDLRQHVTRRRVSVTLIPTQAQLTDLEMKFQESCRMGEMPDSSIQEGSRVKPCWRRVVFPVDMSSDCSPPSSLEEPTPAAQLHMPDSTHSQEEQTGSDGFPSPLQVPRRRCRRHSALSEREHSSEKMVESRWKEWCTPGAWSEDLSGPGAWSQDTSGPGAWAEDTSGPGAWAEDTSGPGAWSENPSGPVVQGELFGPAGVLGSWSPGPAGVLGSWSPGPAGALGSWSPGPAGSLGSWSPGPAGVLGSWSPGPAGVLGSWSPGPVGALGSWLLCWRRRVLAFVAMCGICTMMFICFYFRASCH
ncbi:uncharacterized protein LOC143511762 isoform X2 [Brachyhypopomus gauderio]|uniref:uncharacterized protein LOC143511762 isoform X2 n=1 Tax=Brachyhypopomus gauderio TaxID=698409 RepID=UPI0040417831